jgi:hypothetical protein
MAGLAVVSFAALVFDNIDLGSLADAEHFGENLGARDQGLADLRVAVAGYQENAVECEGFVIFPEGTLDAEHISGSHLVLPAALVDDRIHETGHCEQRAANVKDALKSVPFTDTRVAYG